MSGLGSLSLLFLDNTVMDKQLQGLRRSLVYGGYPKEIPKWHWTHIPKTEILIVKDKQESQDGHVPLTCHQATDPMSWVIFNPGLWFEKVNLIFQMTFPVNWISVPQKRFEIDFLEGNSGHMNFQSELTILASFDIQITRCFLSNFESTSLSVK